MKKIFFLFSLQLLLLLQMLGSFSQNKPSQQDPEVVRLVNEAIQLHQDKDFAGALMSFEAALAIDPTNPIIIQNISIAHNNYGKYLVDRTDYEKAIKEFRYAIFYDRKNTTADANLDALLIQRGVKANDPQVRIQLGDKLKAEPSYEFALIEYQKAQSLSKTQDPNILTSIGDIYYILYLRDGQRGDLINRAIESYKKSLEVKETAKAHIKLGDGLLALRDVSGAIENYRSAVKLEPSSQDALSANIRGWTEAVRLAPLVAENHIGLGSALQLKKDFTNAEEEYNQALKLDPENQIAKQGLDSLAKDKIQAQGIKFSETAVAFQNSGKYDEAIQQYVMALQINSNDAKVHYNIGTAFQAKGDLERAEKAYRKALEIEPNNDKAKAALDLLLKQINNKKVQELSQRALELQNAGSYQEAITTYLAAISVNPNDAAVYYNLGTAYQATKDLNNAQLQYQKALDLDKSNKIYLSALENLKIDQANPLIQSAIAKQNANDLAGAIADYNKALQLVPDDAQTHFNLATAYQANKQQDLAIQAYFKAIQFDPKGQVDAVFFLAGLYEDKKDTKNALDYYQKYLQNAPTGSYAKDAKARMTYLKPVIPVMSAPIKR